MPASLAEHSFLACGYAPKALALSLEASTEAIHEQFLFDLPMGRSMLLRRSPSFQRGETSNGERSSCFPGFTCNR
jgi:hypothetical protein